jgi:hypothetical protein
LSARWLRGRRPAWPKSEEILETFYKIFIVNISVSAPSIAKIFIQFEEMS